MPEFFIGLMSGTSLDGVDGVLADFSQNPPLVVGHASAGFSSQLRAELLELNASGANELHRAALAGNALMHVYADVVAALLRESGLGTESIVAIGAHGQTVRHRPQEFDGTGYTLQLAQPALLAELTGIDVVADFRSRDVAAGGQGAPLAPFFHQSWFSRRDANVGVLNIGGVANITLLQPDGAIVGFDCGPGNSMMDSWCWQHWGRPYDAEGQWAASGRVIPELLASCLDEPFFDKSPPKSTGRDLFNTGWLNSRLAAFPRAATNDVQATLAELTARAASDDAMRLDPDLSELVVCGGGALNTYLMQRLQELMSRTRVVSSATRGLPPQQVEATAFAWLARKTIRREKLPLKSTTGAQGARVLGCVYPR